MDGWYEVDELAPGTVRITEGRGQLPCHMYLLQSKDDALLIDTGLGIGGLRSVVESIAGVTPPVLLTHAHWDHLGNAHQFPMVSVHDRERMDDGTVSLDVFEERFDHRPGIFIEAWMAAGRTLPADFKPDTYHIPPVQHAEPVVESDTVIVGDRTLDIVDIPGHSPGQIAAIDRSSGMCFGGDVLEPNGEIYAHFADSDLAAYEDSLGKLIDRRDNDAFERLLTGHGVPIDDLSILDTAKHAVETVRAGEASYTVIDTHWGASRSYEVSGIRVLTSHTASQ